jgi:hypothetical protein
VCYIFNWQIPSNNRTLIFCLDLKVRPF